MKARLKNYRQSPRKVRLVADVVRGKEVDKAITTLSMLSKRAAPAIKKVIESAVANAKNTGGVSENDLRVKEIQVNGGIVFKRLRARSRGRSSLIRKKTSHILVSLEEIEKNMELSTSNAAKATKVKNTPKSNS